MKKGICNRDCEFYSQERCNKTSKNQACVCCMVEEEDNMHNHTFLRLCSQVHGGKEEREEIGYQ